MGAYEIMRMMLMRAAIDVAVARQTHGVDIPQAKIPRKSQKERNRRKAIKIARRKNR